MRSPPSILVFDSGLGGLTVLREIERARPDAALTYVADDVFFPYGAQEEAALVARVVALIGTLIADHAPDLVVIACNTASTLVLPHLRERYTVPFVGTVPAIKPACAASRNKRVSVLGTQATVKREYTRALIRDFGQGCDVKLVGSARLAGIAEAALRGEPVDDERHFSRDCALLCRRGRPSHRHDRARLHALSASASVADAACAVAGGVDRPCARDRAPGRGSHRQAAPRRAARLCTDIHVRACALAGTCEGARPVRDCDRFAR